MKKGSRIRPAIERMHCVAALLRGGRTFTQCEVARHFESSRKTVQRDMEFMRDRLGYEFAWDGSARTYRLITAPAPKL